MESEKARVGRAEWANRVERRQEIGLTLRTARSPATPTRPTHPVLETSASHVGGGLTMLRLQSALPYAEASLMDQKSAMPISGMVTPPPSRCLSEIGLDRRIGVSRNS